VCWGSQFLGFLSSLPPQTVRTKLEISLAPRELGGRIHKLQIFQFKVVALYACDNWQVGYFFFLLILYFLFLQLCLFASCFWLKDSDCVSLSIHIQSFLGGALKILRVTWWCGDRWNQKVIDAFLRRNIFVVFKTVLILFGYTFKNINPWSESKRFWKCSLII